MTPSRSPPLPIWRGWPSSSETFSEQHAGGEDADPFGVELEAADDLGRGVAAEDADPPLQGLVLEHGADQAPKRCSAAADRDRLGRVLDLDPREESSMRSRTLRISAAEVGRRR